MPGTFIRELIDWPVRQLRELSDFQHPMSPDVHALRAGALTLLYTLRQGERQAPVAESCVFEPLSTMLYSLA